MLKSIQKSKQVPLFHAPSRIDESFRLIEIDDSYSGCSWHFHPEYQLSYVESGQGQRLVGDSVCEIEAGEVILLGANLPHAWRYDRGPDRQALHAWALHFTPDVVGRDFFERPEMRDLRLLLARSGQGLQATGQTRLEVVERFQRLQQQTGFKRVLEFLGILDCLARSKEVTTLCSTVFQPVGAQLDVERLRTVCEFVQAHFQEPITRDVAADLAHLSPSAFSRFFKTHTGMTFQDYISEVRTSHACQLLLDTDLTVSYVAGRCGFAELSTFNRAFRKTRGMTPSQYRRQVIEVRTEEASRSHL